MHHSYRSCPARATGCHRQPAKPPVPSASETDPIVVAAHPHRCNMGNVSYGIVRIIPIPLPQGTVDLSATMQYGPWPRPASWFPCPPASASAFCFCPNTRRPPTRFRPCPRRPGCHSLIRKNFGYNLVQLVSRSNSSFPFSNSRRPTKRFRQFFWHNQSTSKRFPASRNRFRFGAVGRHARLASWSATASGCNHCSHRQSVPSLFKSRKLAADTRLTCCQLVSSPKRIIGLPSK